MSLQSMQYLYGDQSGGPTESNIAIPKGMPLAKKANDYIIWGLKNNLQVEYVTKCILNLF